LSPNDFGAEFALVSMRAGASMWDGRNDSRFSMADDSITLLPMTRFRVAMVLAILADALQLIFFPLFVEGAESPAEDALDLGVAAALMFLLGWHWEFLPSALVKLVPGADLVPLWTLSVANVYRKRKQIAMRPEEGAEDSRG
jgi:hypothetical protein